MKNMLRLVRTANDKANFRDDAAGAGKIILESLTWLTPQVCPSNFNKFQLYKQIE